MRKILLTLFTLLFAVASYAQDGVGTLCVTAIQMEDETYPEEARRSLETKMQRIIQSGGFLSGEGSRFVMTSRIDVTEKDITSQGMFLQKMDVSFYILDVLDDKVFGMANLHVTGVGETETKALIKAFQSIKPTNPALVRFFAMSKDNILNYFKSEAPRIISDAQFKATQGDFEGAYTMLLTVPSLCGEEYDLCREKALELNEKQKQLQKDAVNKDGKKLIQQANSIWAGSHDYSAANRALDLLSKVDPDAECRSEADAMVKSINDYLRADEKEKKDLEQQRYKEQWDFKMREYNDRIQMEQQKQSDKTAVLSALVSRFGRLDINVQKDKTYRLGRAKNN